MNEFISVAAVLCAYLLGSIPWGLVLVRVLLGVDVRSIGSGNIGATNAGRAGGKKVGLAVFVLDFAKGFVAVEYVARLGHEPWLPIACAVAAVLGHCFSIWLRFKGGKGVATMCGAIVALGPVVFLIGGLVWLAFVASTRYVGLASIAMCVAFAGGAWWRGAPIAVVVGLAVLALLIAARHRSNMARMLAGTEPKVFSKRASHG